MLPVLKFDFDPDFDLNLDQEIPVRLALNPIEKLKDNLAVEPFSAGSLCQVIIPQFCFAYPCPHPEADGRSSC